MVIARRLRVLPPLSPRLVAVVLFAAVNVGMALFYLLAMVGTGASAGEDYEIQLVAGHRMLAGESPYTGSGVWAFRYSPFIGAAFALAEPLGIWFWRALHFAVLLLLPAKLAVILGLSWPFWMDVYHANWMAFIAVFGYLALQRKPVGEAGFLIMTLLIPRPLMVPLALWIVWQRRAWWPWLLAGALLYVAAVALTGWGDEWLAKLLSVGGIVPVTFAPAYWLGSLWYLAAPPLVAWLMWQRRFGLAGLAASPYWVIYYFVVLLWDFARPQRSQVAGGDVPDAGYPQAGGAPTSATGHGSRSGSSTAPAG